MTWKGDRLYAHMQLRGEIDPKSQAYHPKTLDFCYYYSASIGWFLLGSQIDLPYPQHLHHFFLIARTTLPLLLLPMQSSQDFFDKPLPVIFATVNRGWIETAREWICQARHRMKGSQDSFDRHLAVIFATVNRG